MAPNEVRRGLGGQSVRGQAGHAVVHGARVFEQLQGQALDDYCHAEPAALQLLQTAAAQLAWSARGIHRSLRVARSIADLAQSETISPAHVAEAVQYRRALLGSSGM